MGTCSGERRIRSLRFDPELAAKHGRVLEDYYREMDGILGEALRAADENTTVLGSPTTASHRSADPST